MAEQDLEPILIPVEWHVPDDLASHYATNLVVQHTEHEFNIFFYEIRPPLLIGSPEEVREGLEKVELVRANCVAHIIVAPDRMPEFVQVLQTSLERYRSKLEEAE